MSLRQPKWDYPLDPECPDNPIPAFQNDPMTKAYGLDGDEEFTEPMEAKHRVKCKRCQEYGAANVGVRY